MFPAPCASLEYDVGFRRAAVTFVLKSIINTLCKVECREYVDALAKNSPLILAINHVNFLEVPLLVTHSYPRFVTGIAKTETWNNTLFSFIFNTYHAIPIDREGAFHDVFRKVGESVDNGYCVIIAPEGTRSKDGVLGRGKAGIIYLSIDTGVPVLPVVHYGGENIWQNMKRFRRTPLRIRAGRPFKILCEGRPDKEEREAIMGEVMGQMARLLPVDKRGPYAQEAQQPDNECKYLEFLR